MPSARMAWPRRGPVAAPSARVTSCLQWTNRRSTRVAMWIAPRPPRRPRATAAKPERPRRASDAGSAGSLQRCVGAPAVAAREPEGHALVQALARAEDDHLQRLRADAEDVRQLRVAH